VSTLKNAFNNSAGRKHRQYTNAFDAIKGLIMQMGHGLGIILSRIVNIDEQMQLIYNAQVKIADKLGVDLSEEPEAVAVEAAVDPLAQMTQEAQEQGFYDDPGTGVEEATDPIAT
jgi:hypothetical protein